WNGKLFRDGLSQGSADVLADFHFSGVNADCSVLADVQPGADLLRQRIAASRGVSGLLRTAAPEDREHDQPGSGQFEKVAATEIKMIGRRGREFVALGFEVSERFRIHDRTPLDSLAAR